MKVLINIIYVLFLCITSIIWFFPYVIFKDGLKNTYNTFKDNYIWKDHEV